jgi:hypothetical protein
MKLIILVALLFSTVVSAATPAEIEEQIRKAITSTYASIKEAPRNLIYPSTDVDRLVNTKLLNDECEKELIKFGEQFLIICKGKQK